MTATPFVSIIIPVLNGEKYIERCLDSLVKQSYPSDRYEIILVDNGSTDKTVEIAKNYSQVIILKENKKGSYAARNLGVKYAKGEYIAFTDVDCIADSKWIQNAINMLKQDSHLVIGGKVELFSETYTVWGSFDKVTFLNQEKAVQAGSAVTANLIVSKKVFLEVGYFDSSLQSGGDVDWTKRCKKMNYKLEYSDNVKVFHPVRSTFKDLVNKCFRVGYGVGQVNRKRNRAYALIKPSVTLPALKNLKSIINEVKSHEKPLFISLVTLIIGLLTLQSVNYLGKIYGFLFIEYPSLYEQ